MKILTPRVDPKTPPTNSIKPILKSTFFFLQWAITQETEDANTWGASVPTATAGGKPKKIKKEKKIILIPVQVSL